MPEIRVKKADWAQALDPKYRYIFIRGGRSSGKSWEVANYLVKRSLQEKDLKIVCLREVQKSIDKSSKSLIDSKIDAMQLHKHYKSVNAEVRKTSDKDGGLFYFQGMNDLTADNIKSLEGFKIAWFEEAQNASHYTLKVLRPTIREQDSQIIFTWNPKFPEDAIDEFCNQVANEPDVLVIHVNYNDNPFLSDAVKREVALDRANNAEDFPHIWLGEYDQSFHGHYYAKYLEAARAEKRITEVPRTTGVDILTAWDLGRADATAIWVAQVVGLQPRIIDYIEGRFEDLSYYADWIKKNNYNGFHALPHDAGHKRLGMQGSIQDQLNTMGLTNSAVLPAMIKDAGRKLAQKLIREAYFDEQRCKQGIQVLRHEKAERDEKTNSYKEIHEQDGAAAFRYLAQYLEKQETQKPKPRDDYVPQGTSWMA